MSLLRLVVAVFLVAATTHTFAPQQKPSSSSATDRAVAAAKAFLGTLDEAKRAKTNVALTTDTRAIWSNLPAGSRLQTGATERNGLKLADLSPVQEKAALALVASVLSRDGYSKAMQIVDADQQLGPPRFGRAQFYVAVLGTPSATDTWMIQFGGHHLAINVTLAGRENVLAPTHTGVQPASYTVEGRAIRPLGDENDKAFALMNALSAGQQKQALVGDKVLNLVLGPGADGKMIQPEGIKASAMTENQRAMLIDLAREWIDIIGDEAAVSKLADVRANVAETYFAWAGSTVNGQPAYFRIQGPTVFIEYAPQGPGGGGTDHIHTIYRDPTNDYASKASGR
jgi:hypothetical protein